MRKAILAAVTGALILGGSVAVLAQDETRDEIEPDGPVIGAIEEVLDELVADSTLTQEQADAVVAALEARRVEFLAQREAVRQQLEEFWADDQLTQEEIDQLPEWHPWSEATDLLEDGVVTRDELQDVRPWRHRRFH